MKSTVYYLEMSSRGEFCPSEIPDGLELRSVRDWALNERLYREVGHGMWADRLVWTEEQWQEWVGREGLETCLAFYEGEEAGYVEFERQEGGNVEIVYFGLRPEMLGKGLGAAMLTMVVQWIWESEETLRIWLHTCTEDHPHAISNYEKRGFCLFKTEVMG